jgi:FG-GAP-like repeat/Bacterial Ig-like domain (group 3)
MIYSPIVTATRPTIFMQVSLRRWMPVLLSALAMATGGSAAWAVNTTTTSLLTTPDNPSSGAVITMTAQVQNTEHSIDGGTVTFVDTYNGVSEVVGTVQVQSGAGNEGTAILRTEVGGVGQHQFVATYGGTASFSSSSSTAQTVNFIAPYLSATTLAGTGGGPYSFTGTVSAFGPTAPTGSVTFTDTTSSFTLGTVGLNAGSLQTGFTSSRNYAIANLNNGNTGGTIGPAIGDFNGDGRLDYAVPANSGSIVILLGNGDGTFTTGTPIATAAPFEPTAVVVGDFNGDGKQDLAVLSGAGAGTVNIYLGAGNGTFGAPSSYPVAPSGSTSASRLLAVGDFNQDGIQDLVATNSSLNNVAVLLGVGDGSFGAPAYYAVSGTPWNVAVGDINQDGFLDLAVAADDSSSVSVLQGLGNGAFKPAISINTPGSQAGSVALGDFNGDGYLDLATTSAPDNSVYILLNKKTAIPSFETSRQYPMNSGPYYLTIGDFNRDGKADIISANNGNATVGVMLGNGSGAFAAATYYQVAAGAIFATEGDINGDDQVDLTAVTNDGLSVLLSGQSETATLSNIAISGCTTQSVTATYTPDGTYGSSTSAPFSFTPTAAATRLTLTVDPAVGVVGQQVTLTATISPFAFGSTTTNGKMVTFQDNNVVIGSAPLNNGVATLVVMPGNGAGIYQALYDSTDCAFTSSRSQKVIGNTLLASTITWAPPASIAYGTRLSKTQLNATDNIPGRLVYHPAAGTVLAAGTTNLTVTFIPFNNAYGVETATVPITVTQDPTVIIWPVPTPISYGTPLSSFQLDATASTGIISVPLAKYFNVNGIYDPGLAYNNPPTGGFDNDGYSYSTATLGSTLVWNGMTFNLGPPDQLDAVYGQTITLPEGKFANLYMLGAMVNNVLPSQTFVVTYTDGSTTTLNQNMSDWFNAAGWPGESVISCSEKRNFQDGTQQADSVCIYGYQIALDADKKVSTVSLPNTQLTPSAPDRNIVMLAMDLATPQIPGTFVYTPPAGTIEPVGTDTLSVTFTPTNATDYAPASATVQLVVSNPVGPIVTPGISWPEPTPITYGTPLSSVQLDAQATGAPRPTPVALTNQLKVLSTSKDGVGYNLAGFDGAGGTYSYNSLGNGVVNFAGAAFTLGQPNVPNALTNGAVYTLATPGNYTALYLVGAAVAQSAEAQPFTLTYSTGGAQTANLFMSSWTQSSAGYKGLADETVIAAPTYKNMGNGTSVAGNFYLYGYVINVDASRTLTSVTLPQNNNVVIMALGFSTKDPVVVPGTYSYDPGLGVVLPVGRDPLSVTFTPSDPAGYNPMSAKNSIRVIRATPILTWPTPASIPAGTALTTQLDAVATFQGAILPGNYVYTYRGGVITEGVDGTVLPPGVDTLTVVFTPTDRTDFTTATASVQIVVGSTGGTTVGGSPAFAVDQCCYFSQPTPYNVTVSGSSVPPTGIVQAVFNGHTIGTGTLTPQAGATSTVLLDLDSSYFFPAPPSTNAVTLNYLGDTHYFPTSSSVNVPLLNPAISAHPTTAPTGFSTIEAAYAFPVAGTMTYTFTPGGIPASEFTDTGATTCSSGTPQPIDTVCTLSIAFRPKLPGIRRGVVQINFTPAPTPSNPTPAPEPTLYLFLSGLGSASQIWLSNATQTVLNNTLNQPQSLTFSPTDLSNSTLYVANSDAGQLDTLASSGGALTQLPTANLQYPIDLAFDVFDNLLVPDEAAAKLFSFAPSPGFAESTLSTGTIALSTPTATRIDFGGNIYIADAGSTTQQIVEIPGETYASYVPSIFKTLAGGSFPQALAVDNSGANLYVGDGNFNTVQEIGLATGAATSVPIAPCGASVTSCAFNGPSGFAFDPNGDLFLTDGQVRVLMVPAAHSLANPTVQVPLTGLVNPSGITLDGWGNIYVSDLNGTVNKLAVTSGAINFTTLNSSQTTTVTNTGNLGLTFTAPPTFASGTAYTLGENTCIGTIPAGGTCTIAVTYSNAGGTASDTLTIHSNAFSTGLATIALTHN